MWFKYSNHIMAIQGHDVKTFFPMERGMDSIGKKCHLWLEISVGT